VSVSSAGDVNGDGFDDLIVGALLGDDGGGNAGEAYVVFGGATGTESTVAVSRTGTASADNFTGNAGDDTFTGIGANDVVRGGAGADAISVSALTFADIDGGRGSDTLSLSGSGLSLDLTGPGTAGVGSIEVIDLTGTGNNTVILDRQAVFDLTEERDGGEATLTIRGNAGDTADLGGLTGGFTANGSVTENSITYTIFSSGTANVRVQQGVTVSSADAGGGFAVASFQESFELISTEWLEDTGGDVVGSRAADPGTRTEKGYDDGGLQFFARLQILEEVAVDLNDGPSATPLVSDQFSVWNTYETGTRQPELFDQTPAGFDILNDTQLVADLLYMDASLAGRAM
jgi:hypothetical protein